MRESGFVVKPLQVGSVITSPGVGQVLSSNSPTFFMGDFVYSNFLGWGTRVLAKLKE
jgi:NADPH-dependent curcumin reductase CurA